MARGPYPRQSRQFARPPLQLPSQRIGPREIALQFQGPRPVMREDREDPHTSRLRLRCVCEQRLRDQTDPDDDQTNRQERQIDAPELSHGRE